MTEGDGRRTEAGVEPARASQGERYAMNENSNVVPLRQPDEIDDPLTNILRSGARQLLAQAVEMEAEAFLAAMKGLKLPDGRDRLVRHGHGPVRTIQTGIGAVEVERVKIRDRAAASDVERGTGIEGVYQTKDNNKLNPHYQGVVKTAAAVFDSSDCTICAENWMCRKSRAPSISCVIDSIAQPNF